MKKAVTLFLSAFLCCTLAEHLQVRIKRPSTDNGIVTLENLTNESPLDTKQTHKSDEFENLELTTTAESSNFDDDIEYIHNIDETANTKPLSTSNEKLQESEPREQNIKNINEIQGNSCKNVDCLKKKSVLLVIEQQKLAYNR